MSQPNGSGSDPIDRLRAADPVRADGVPDASLARVTARIQEHIVTDIALTPANRPPTPARSPCSAALALAGAFALAIARSEPGNGVPAPDRRGPEPTENPPPVAVAWPRASPTTRRTCRPSTSCSTAPSPPSMATRSPSTSTRAGRAPTGSITLTVQAVDIALVGRLPDFEVGGRYLVTAAGSTINACGYTLDYDAETAAAWAAAFGG